MTIERTGVTRRWCDSAAFNGIVFLAGHLAEQTVGRSLTEQAREALALLDETLAAAGSGKERLLSVQIFLADMSLKDELNAVWDEWVAPGAPPARATVGAELGTPGHLIEITAVAAKNPARHPA